MKTLNVENAIPVRDGLVLIPPESIRVEEGFNGRRFRRSFQSLVPDILATGGNSVPIKVRRDKDNNPVLVTGERRLAALLHINENKLHLHEDGHSTSLMAKCEIEDLDDQAAFIENVRENVQREDLSVMDKAFVIERLASSPNGDPDLTPSLNGMSQKDISRLMGVSEAQVSNLRKLNRCPARVQKLLDKGPEAGGIAVSTALEVLSMPEEDQPAAWEELLGGGRKTRDEVKRKKQAKADAGGEGRRPRPSAKMIATDIEGYCPDPEEKRPSKTDRVFLELSRYVTGKISARTMYKNVGEIVT